MVDYNIAAVQSHAFLRSALKSKPLIASERMVDVIRSLVSVRVYNRRTHDVQSPSLYLVF